MRRLTQEQYRNTIQDVFGDVALSGQFEPDPPADHLIAVGSSQAIVTPAGLEGYKRTAMGIGAQIVDPLHRDQMIPCKPVSTSAPDDACARQFLAKVGRLLFRRPMTQEELASFVKVAADGANQVSDFYFGLQLALAGLLQSPNFLFIHDEIEQDPEAPGAYRLTQHAMASRLSFMLWNAPPDLELLDAAERGELRTRRGLKRQVERMMASPRLEIGVRVFFADMLSFAGFEVLAKDTQLYPSYNRDVARQAQEQTLRTIVDHLLVKDGDYRDLFTTSKTFLKPLLASVYRVPTTGYDTKESGWMEFELPKDMPQAGILTQVSFVALHSHPGKTSPTLRGRALRELLMCQKVPDPPADVDFSKFEQADNTQAPTVRQRLLMHNTEPACAGCHKIMDPIGLALENFDTVGAFRLTENSQPIDVSGEVDGVSYKDASGLGAALHDNPRTTACLVERVYSYAVGRTPSRSERTWLREHAQKSFAADGYRLKPLLRGIALNPGFYQVVPQQASKI